MRRVARGLRIVVAGATHGGSLCSREDMTAKRIGIVLSVLVPLVACASPAAAQIDEETMRETTEVGLRWALKGEYELVPAEQREALGLDDISWTRRYGKVHPDVYEALEKAERIGERAKKARECYLDMFGFAGMVYVQVQLKHEQKGRADSAENKAAVKRLQEKVLSQLTAAEFFVRYPFETLPGILGHARRSAVEKLKANANVVAVCLDDKPFPRRPEPVRKADLPPLEPGDPSTQPAQGRFWGSGGKVEAAVYQALGMHERVFVIVGLNVPDASPLSDEGIAETREIANRVLADLTASEFWAENKGEFLCGRVNNGGLAKLARHPDVEGVGSAGPRFRIGDGLERHP